MQKQPEKPVKQEPQLQDDNLGIMVYGNIKIKDLDTGKILVNQRA
jgi:hypothetical protein